MASSRFTLSWNKFPVLFHLAELKPYPVNNSPLPHSSSPVTIVLLSVSVNLTVLELSCKWSHIVLVCFVTGLFCLMSSRLIHISVWGDFLPSPVCIILHCVHIPRFVYLTVRAHLDGSHLCCYECCDTHQCAHFLSPCFQFLWIYTEDCWILW